MFRGAASFENTLHPRSTIVSCATHEAHDIAQYSSGCKRNATVPKSNTTLSGDVLHCADYLIQHRGSSYQNLPPLLWVGVLLSCTSFLKVPRGIKGRETVVVAQDILCALVGRKVVDQRLGCL